MELPEIVTVADIAREAGCSQSAVYRKIRTTPELEWLQAKPRRWLRVNIEPLMPFFQIFSVAGNRVREKFEKTK